MTGARMRGRAAIRIAEPLPECQMCEAPVKRSTFDRTGGLCSSCDSGIGRASAMLPPARAVEPRP